MADLITPSVSDRICKHMNEDHQDAIVLYAKTFGQVFNATEAKMLAVDPEGMNLEVGTDQDHFKIRINFDHILKDSEDAHHTLIAMVKQARNMI